MAWTAPTTRVNGDIITASIWNADLVENLKFLNERVLFRNTTDSAAITGTSEEEFDTNVQHTPASGYLNLEDKCIRITLSGIFTSGITQTNILRLRFNSTSQLGSNTVTMPNSRTNAPWKSVIEFRVVTAGASAQIFGTLHTWYDSGSAPTQDMSGGTSSAYNLTGSQIIKVTKQFGAGGNSITMKSMIIEDLKAAV